MIMTAVDMVRRKGHELDDHTIREELEGNLCRCTGYHNIVKAIAAGARAMKGAGTRRRPSRAPPTEVRHVTKTKNSRRGPPNERDRHRRRRPAQGGFPLPHRSGDL
jgi:xanthine dehydrogenase iron-sulfur cluster and FAD-binding subunit A